MHSESFAKNIIELAVHITIDLAFTYCRTSMTIVFSLLDYLADHSAEALSICLCIWTSMKTSLIENWNFQCRSLVLIQRSPSYKQKRRKPLACLLVSLFLFLVIFGGRMWRFSMHLLGRLASYLPCQLDDLELIHCSGLYSWWLQVMWEHDDQVVIFKQSDDGSLEYHIDYICLWNITSSIFVFCSKTHAVVSLRQNFHVKHDWHRSGLASWRNLRPYDCTECREVLEHLANTLVFIVAGAIIAGRIYKSSRDDGAGIQAKDWAYAFLLWIYLTVSIPRSHTFAAMSSKIHANFAMTGTISSTCPSTARKLSPISVHMNMVSGSVLHVT